MTGGVFYGAPELIFNEMLLWHLCSPLHKRRTDVNRKRLKKISILVMDWMFMIESSGSN
jgi:hypothetical protein